MSGEVDLSAVQAEIRDLRRGLEKVGSYIVGFMDEWRLSLQQGKERRAQDTWDYMTDRWVNDGKTDWVTFLDGYGAVGWELVLAVPTAPPDKRGYALSTVEPHSGYVTCTFKRRLL